MALLPFGSPPGLSQTAADTRYVNVTGDTMTGTLDVQTNGVVLQAAGTIAAGNPVGLLLSLTYAATAGGNRYLLTVDSTGHLVTTLI